MEIIFPIEWDDLYEMLYASCGKNFSIDSFLGETSC